MQHPLLLQSVFEDLLAVILAIVSAAVLALASVVVQMLQRTWQKK